MKEDKKNTATANKPATGKAVKKEMPVKNTVTDVVKNAATQTNGLNQAIITSNDLFPSDGDNLTN
jgi:hypothetical protein